MSFWTYPEIVISRCPHVVAITQEVAHESGAKVPGKIDGIAGFISETST